MGENSGEISDMKVGGWKNGWWIRVFQVDIKNRGVGFLLFFIFTVFSIFQNFSMRPRISVFLAMWLYLLKGFP